MDLTNGRDSAAIKLAEALVADIIHDAILIYTGNILSEDEPAPNQNNAKEETPKHPEFLIEDTARVSRPKKFSFIFCYAI